MVMRDACPVCGSQQFKKNGHIHNGKQNHRCKACGRQFVVHAEDCVIPEEQRTLVKRLLREKIGSPGIPVVMGQSSLSRRARPLELLGRPRNDVLFSREFRKSHWTAVSSLIG